MSVIIRHLPTGKIQLLTKGADSVIEKLMAKGQETELKECMKFLHQYAVNGLRTLLLTKRDLTEVEYQQWNSDFMNASMAVMNREELVVSVNERIEHNLELVGSSAIEDKL
jgi:magnesium-transporting ATPase (P-type)